MVLNGTIIGILSGRVDDSGCARGSPDVYTNVYHYLDRIEEYVQDSEYPKYRGYSSYDEGESDSEENDSYER